jgi:short-subunit dehydrogenase
MSIAVITGASSGMGRDFARHIAMTGEVDEFWLVARREERLKELGDELSELYGVSCVSLALDLAEPSSVQVYREKLEAEKPDIKYLVNASGFGRFALSTEVPLEVSLEIAEVNDKALMAFCFLSIPLMAAGSHIINMGSLSSFQPVPYINVYAASKAFVLSFSRALNRELKPRGISVICICPGWVQTEFFDRAASDNGAVTYYNKLWASEDVVVKAMKDLRRGKDVSVLGARIRLQVLATKLLPHKLVMNIWLKQQKHQA